MNRLVLLTLLNLPSFFTICVQLKSNSKKIYLSCNLSPVSSDYKKFFDLNFQSGALSGSLCLCRDLHLWRFQCSPSVLAFLSLLLPSWWTNLQCCCPPSPLSNWCNTLLVFLTLEYKGGRKIWAESRSLYYILNYSWFTPGFSTTFILNSLTTTHSWLSWRYASHFLPFPSNPFAMLLSYLLSWAPLITISYLYLALFLGSLLRIP